MESGEEERRVWIREERAESISEKKEVFMAFTGLEFIVMRENLVFSKEILFSIFHFVSGMIFFVVAVFELVEKFLLPFLILIVEEESEEREKKFISRTKKQFFFFFLSTFFSKHEKIGQSKSSKAGRDRFTGKSSTATATATPNATAAANKAKNTADGDFKSKY